MHALAVLSQLQPRFTYNTYHTSSVVTGIRGAKEGVSPPGEAYIYVYIYVPWLSHAWEILP